MSEFITVAKVGEIPEGRGGTFCVGDYMVAVFHIQGAYHAIDDLCPHMGASLGAGELDGEAVTCPWHAWRFNVKSGVWCDNPKVGVKQFEVRLVGDEIQVSTTPKPAPPKTVSS